MIIQLAATGILLWGETTPNLHSFVLFLRLKSQQTRFSKSRHNSCFRTFATKKKTIIKKKGSFSTVIKKARLCLIKQSIHNKTKRRQKHHSPKPNPW